MRTRAHRHTHVSLNNIHTHTHTLTLLYISCILGVILERSTEKYLYKLTFKVSNTINTDGDTTTSECFQFFSVLTGHTKKKKKGGGAGGRRKRSGNEAV